MEITFNNKIHLIREKTCLQSIINELIGEKQNGIAVAINASVIPQKL